VVRRSGIVVGSAVVVALVLSACSPAGSGDAGRADRTSAGLAVEAYVEPGDAALARVADAAPRVATVGVDGVTLTDDGGELRDPPEGTRGLVRAATDGGARAELLVSNFSEGLGDFSPEVGTALLSDAGKREHVARRLAEVAQTLGADGVQLDLESLRARDRPGLVALAAAVSDAVHDRLGDDAQVSMAVMASTTPAAYRDTGYDLPALAEHVDRFVLMTYDQHGPWSDPGPIGSLSWTRRAVAAARDAGAPTDRLDLGVAGYGYGWGSDAAGQVSVADARRTAGDAARWSDRTGEWSATLGDGRRLHWSDARSWRVRVDLARELGLHGAALWSLDGESLPH
jgi:spore germination protein YaaH